MSDIFDETTAKGLPPPLAREVVGLIMQALNPEEPGSVSITTPGIATAEMERLAGSEVEVKLFNAALEMGFRTGRE